MRYHCHGGSRIIICRSICNCIEALSCSGAGIPQGGGHPHTSHPLLAGQGKCHLTLQVQMLNSWIFRQRSPSYSPPRSSNRRSPPYEAPRGDSYRCIQKYKPTFQRNTITGRDREIGDAPGLLQQEAGKEMDGRSMRKIVEYLRLVEPLFRLSTAGEKDLNVFTSKSIYVRLPKLKRSRSRSPSQRPQIPWEDEETLRSLNCKACQVKFPN